MKLVSINHIVTESTKIARKSVICSCIAARASPSYERRFGGQWGIFACNRKDEGVMLSF